jgi:hypothetical protein
MEVSMFRVISVLIVVSWASAANAQALGQRQAESRSALLDTSTSLRVFPGLAYSMTEVPLDAAYAINNAGVIAGSVGGRAAVFSAGAVTTLQAPQSYTDVRADDIANSGRIVGSGMSAGHRRVLYWENAQSSGVDIGAIGRLMFPQSINSQGVIVGYYYPTSMDDLPQGFRWSSATGHAVITPWGAEQAQPFDISDTGYIAGVAWYSGIGQQAVRWYPNGDNGRITGPAYAHRALDDGSVFGIAAGIGSTLWNLNNAATPIGPAPGTHVVRQRNSANRWVGYTLPGARPWTSVGTGAAVYLPTPANADGFAHDVNACGTILGSVTLNGTGRPVYWSRLFCDSLPIFAAQ